MPSSSIAPFHSYRCCLLLFYVLSQCVALTTNNISPSTKQRLLQAIALTKGSAANISLAHEACELWGDLLAIGDNNDNFKLLGISQDIRGMCLVLYGSCLVRIGQDDQAVNQFWAALKGDHALSKENKEEAILGRGRALQRLLQYTEAKNQFMELYKSSESAACGAAICALRLGDIAEAARLLRMYLGNNNNRNNIQAADGSEARDILGILEILSDENIQSDDTRQLPTESLLPRWARLVASKSLGYPIGNAFGTPQETLSYFELAKTNIAPFDDHRLLHLDDKVLLHKVLSSPQSNRTSHFWPLGFVESTQAASISNLDEEREENKLWVHKHRSGYGSHGNTVVRMQEAQKIALSLDGQSLLQRLVQPALLLEGRKFSLRIYVVYFKSISTNTPDLYISTKGLVKVASLTVSATETVDMRVHMTNSGRETDMIQLDLDYLQSIFVANDWSFEALWSKIVNAVRTSVDIYHQYVHQPDLEPFSSNNEQARLAKLGIPKILGFDFVVDDTKNPWLIEINRFPGLEARDESDQGVKHQVLRDTWLLASRRANLTNTEMEALFGGLFTRDEYEAKLSCLERIE